ncbi:YdaS family helix-turn-helix protein [Pontibacterium sp.]|uniref:YdaS family helix-turn-helix protein n=1 Tax=Pontibacterium sp. TaxID=2036026 RepID=UPI00356A88F8
MTLDEYIKKFPRHERSKIRSDLASRLGCTVATITHYANGIRNFPPELKKVESVEALTGGEVTRYDLLPLTYGLAPQQAA